MQGLDEKRKNGNLDYFSDFCSAKKCKLTAPIFFFKITSILKSKIKFLHV